DRERGMTAKYDSVDWIGGYPYEYATYETLVGYFEARGFELVAGKRSTGLGCHELVFRRL
ncbi:MAG: class I SAM-dependent methyltransferase, partial [Woeseiaceae bacterium]